MKKLRIFLTEKFVKVLSFLKILIKMMPASATSDEERSDVYLDFKWGGLGESSREKKWEKLVFLTNQGGGGLTESQLFGKISQN